LRLSPFQLHRPGTVEEAVGLLQELGPDALPYCGGTELLLVAKLGLTDFQHLVDLKGIAELRGVEANHGLRIGAATTHREIERSEAVRSRWPSLASMEHRVGNVRVRNVGTIGGNLCFADPHSDPATYLIAAGGRLTVRGQGEPRELQVEEFTRGPYETALQPAELLVAVHVPEPAAGAVLVHRKLSFHERPAITIAVSLTARNGQVAEARVAAGSIGVAAQRLTETEQSLVGLQTEAPSERALAGSVAIAAREAQAVEDANGSVEYKRQLVGVLTGRCLREALSAHSSAA
jgi:carbon-monoxide dehydrogenase medium subunit